VRRGPVLGLDIGGSSSRARLSDGGHVTAEAEGPGANVAELGPRLVERRLTSLLEALGPIQPVACCAGSAGAEVPAGRARLERLLQKALPGCDVTVVHDTRLVLAAAGLDTGIALIAGTGSVAYGRDTRGREARVGGWGWLLGDDGSGVWVTREAVREVLRRLDTGEPEGAMGEAILAATGARRSGELTGRMHQLREPGEWAALAGLVFDAADRDDGAARIVERAAAELSRLVETVRARLEVTDPVVIAGGLLLNQPLLEAALRERLGSVIRLVLPPVAGAVRLAEASLSA
jgi:glucosamine kinase